MNTLVRATTITMLCSPLLWACGSDSGKGAAPVAEGTGEATETSDMGTETGGGEGATMGGAGDGDGDSTTDTGEPEPECGDGKVDAGEECDLGPLLSDNGGCTTKCMLAVCGDGLLYIGEEACDDGNTDESDDCTSLCEAPGCDDGFKSGEESDIDCGGGCLPCDVGLNCTLSSDCKTWACDDGVCGYADSCAAINAVVPEAPTGRYWIDVDEDGPNQPFEVWCELEQAGGGWTLVLVSSDDDQATWTWANRSWMATDATTVGSLDERNHDFKSQAYNEMVFRDILTVHQPSGMWAQYDDVSGGNTDLGHFVGAVPSPNCNDELAGNGLEMTDGTLVAGVNDQGEGLCDTDLYVNLGDHESNIEYCLGSLGCSTATYGLVWNRGGNDGCDFDDANTGSLGPASQCACCEPGTDMVETNGRGFASPLGLNTGAAGAGENFIQVLLR